MKKYDGLYRDDLVKELEMQDEEIAVLKMTIERLGDQIKHLTKNYKKD